MGARVTRCSGNATGAHRGAYSRVCGASTAFRPVAVGVGGAERGAPVSQSAYRRVCGAATPKGAAQRGCSATGPTPDGRRRGTGTIQKWSQSPCATGPPPSFASCFRLWYEGVGEESLQRQLFLDDAASIKPVVHRLPPRRLLPQFPRKER